MKVLIVYKSISGFTKKYAPWISAELNADCTCLADINKFTFSEYDFLIFGGSLHAVGINGYKKFKACIPETGADKIIIFAVGASPANPGIEEEIRSANLKDPSDKNIPLFYLRGGFDYSKLDFPNKIIMKMLKWQLTFKKNRTQDETEMLRAYKTPLDAADRKNIEPLINFLKNKYPL